MSKSPTTQGLYIAPIGVHEMKACLGTKGLDVGQLCTSTNINMWSKVKPFRSKKAGFATDAEFQDALYKADCGLKITEYTSLDSLLTAAKALGIDGLAWTYLRPQGRISELQTEYYRLLDFNGYLHKTNSKPYIDYALNQTEGYIIDTIKIKQGSRMGQVAPAYEITKEALYSLNKHDNLYCGFVCRRPDVSGTTKWMPFAVSGSTGYDIVPSDFFPVYGETYDCAFFFSNVQVETGVTPASGSKFYLIPYPYTTFERYNTFGIAFGCTHVSWLGDYTLSFQDINSATGAVKRHCKNVTFHTRKDDNVVAIEPSGCYQFANGHSTASGVLTDRECDVTSPFGSTVADVWLYNNMIYRDEACTSRIRNTMTFTNYDSSVAKAYVRFTFVDDSNVEHTYMRRFQFIEPIHNTGGIVSPPTDL